MSNGTKIAVVLADEDGRVRQFQWRTNWTAERRATFLDHLASTCNVSAAAAAIGVPLGAVYYLRRKDADFRAAWAEAIQRGYEMVETALVGHVLDRDGPFDPGLAQRLLAQHKDGGEEGKRGGPRLVRVTSAQTDASILRKLDALKRDAARRRKAKR